MAWGKRQRQRQKGSLKCSKVEEYCVQKKSNINIIQFR